MVARPSEVEESRKSKSKPNAPRPATASHQLAAAARRDLMRPAKPDVESGCESGCEARSHARCDCALPRAREKPCWGNCRFRGARWAPHNDVTCGCFVFLSRSLASKCGPEALSRCRQPGLALPSAVITFPRTRQSHHVPEPAWISPWPWACRCSASSPPARSSFSTACRAERAARARVPFPGARRRMPVPLLFRRFNVCRRRVTLTHVNLTRRAILYLEAVHQHR